ncbi:MAG: winged helix DNA-binding protein [Candidatus Heimdallarchaeota archaeon]|nr:winged helix DNA-binding protein [Candidatus Heimdallarchaeota archaeon]
MIIQIATQGTSTSPILEGVRSYSIDFLYLLHNEGSKSTALEVKEMMNNWDIQCKLEEIQMFDQTSITNKIIEIYKNHKHDEILVNITGGTKLMSAAAAVSAVLIGAKAFYMIEQVKGEDKSLKERTLELPMPKVSAIQINEQQTEILSLISDQGGTMVRAINQVRDYLEISKQMASYHIKELENQGLIRLELDGRMKRAIITPEGQLILNLKT